MNECLVPRFDSKINPGRSSLRIVACCCPSELWMWSSESLRDVRDQLPTTSRVGPGLERMGCDTEVFFTTALARCSFSRNSPRFSKKNLMILKNNVSCEIFMVVVFKTQQQFFSGSMYWVRNRYRINSNPQVRVTGYIQTINQSTEDIGKRKRQEQ